MQIIQSLLGTQVKRLGIRKPLGDSYRLLLRRESSSLHGHSSVIKPLANHLPLVTYSKFLLSQENQAFSDPFIDSNSPETGYINTEFIATQFNTLDSIIEDGNHYHYEDIQGDIPNIWPTQNPSNTNNIAPELNIKTKSKSKKTDKSGSTQKKSKAKSSDKKNVTSSASDNVNGKVEEIPVVNNSQQFPLLTPDEPPVQVANFENSQAPESQNIVLDNSLNNENSVIINSVSSLIDLPIIEDESVLVENWSGDENQALSDALSTVPSAESATIVHAANISESMMLSPQNTELEASVRDSVKNSSVEPPATNTGDTFTLLNNLNNSEQTVIQEAPQAVDVSDILTNPTSQQQEVATNPNILRQQEGLSHTSSDVVGISDIATDLISNRLPESSNSLSATTQARVEETPNLSHDLVNISEVPSAVTTNAEFSITVTTLDATNNLNVSTPEITSGELTTNIPVQLAATSPVIIDNSIAASGLQSKESVNFVDASESVTLVQTDNASNIPVELSPTPPVITNNPIIASQLQSGESVNFVDASENVTPVQIDGVDNVPIQLAPTSPVIADNSIVTSELQSGESENVTSVQTDNASNISVELSPTSPVIADNSIVASESKSEESENVTFVQTDNASNIPVELFPTSPVVRNNPIVASELQSGESENVTFVQTDNASNIPVELFPTSPVIRDKPIVASQSQSGESVNFGDASESVVLSPDDSQPNTDIQAVVTPPITHASVTSPDFTAPQGFATGGQVTHISVENPQIAASDTVPAMLTPGEFVINANDAQKNLHILRHINTGGTPEDIILPSLELPISETPTKVDSFPDTLLQRQKSDSRVSEESNSLIPTSLGTEISQHRLSSPSSLQLNSVEKKATAITESSPHYSLPKLIFRKPSANNNTSYETPNQWSSVEELLTSFDFNSVESNWQNPESPQVSQSSATPQISTKRQISPQSFANGGEVTAPDIARDIQPITETVESPSANSAESDESANLETLAYEIYNRLRQRIEVERERQGIYHGRLPW